jgi:Fe-S cluster biogenesis protein NfuA
VTETAVADLTRAVQAALDEVRPRIHGHNGDVSIASVSPEGDVHLQFHDACIGCPFQPMTFGGALYDPVSAVPGVREVYLDGARVSQAALQRIRRMASGEATFVQIG